MFLLTFEPLPLYFQTRKWHHGDQLFRVLFARCNGWLKRNPGLYSKRIRLIFRFPSQFLVLYYGDKKTWTGTRKSAWCVLTMSSWVNENLFPGCCLELRQFGQERPEPWNPRRNVTWGPGHTEGWSKFICKSFVVACKLCGHSCLQQGVPFRPSAAVGRDGTA